MEILKLAPGYHRLRKELNCPACGLFMNRTHGIRSGTHQRARDAKPEAGVATLMVCGRCEVAILTIGHDAPLTINALEEAALTVEMRESLRETRNDLRLKKALGLLKFPPQESRP